VAGRIPSPAINEVGRGWRLRQHGEVVDSIEATQGRVAHRRGLSAEEHTRARLEEQRVTQVVEVVTVAPGTAASLNSSGGSRFSTRRGDAALEHSGEAGDGFRHSGARRSNRCCRFRTAEMAAGRRFMARERARPCRPGAARGTPDGDSALMSEPGVEREKLTGGTPW
jgi:hypothetical protein